MNRHRDTSWLPHDLVSGMSQSHDAPSLEPQKSLAATVTHIPIAPQRLRKFSNCCSAGLAEALKPVEY